ncbi:MAG: hypothetical protein J3Q66DRAFT_347018 [Benniella sp.]|nr:MAG: hypothetical protein J3Q66DRAFT_347018 [Benniella sp.]
MTTPDWTKHTVEDATEHLDISALLEEHGKVIELKGGGSKERRIAFAGTDYGVCKMSETVPQTLDQIHSHLNRYQVLAGLQDTSDGNEDGKEVKTSSSSTPALPVPTSGLSKQQRAETLAAIKLPEAITITAPQISEASSTRRIERRRQRRLERPENKVTKQALTDISSSSQSLLSATTINDVDTIQKARRGNRDILRSFENSDARQRDKRTQRLHTKKTMSKLAAAERRAVQDHARSPPPCPPVVSPSDGWCSECSRHHLPRPSGAKPFQHAEDCPRHECDVLPVLMIGTAGTGMGSRIGGHERRGGGKMRKEHTKSCVVSMTNEYRTSQVCVFCFEPLRLSRARRVVGGQEKVVNLHGSIECINSRCEAFRCGYTRARDTNSAVAIAIAGASVHLHPRRQVLPPFTRTVLPRNHPHYEPQSSGWIPKQVPVTHVDATGAPSRTEGI